MHFPPLVYLIIIAVYEIDRAHSEPNVVNIFTADDGVDFETPLFLAGNGGNDASLTADSAIKQQLPITCVGTIGQEDLSTSSPSSDTNLFVRDPDHQNHEQCLPPVNIGADVFNLWKDPLFELERQSTPPPPTNGDKTPDATEPPESLMSPGPGPEGPKLPTLLAPPFDHSKPPDQSSDGLDLDDQPIWKDYEGRVYDKSGFGIGSFGSERLEDYDIDTDTGIDEEDYNPCNAPWRPDGYEFDLCCDGQAFLSRQVTEWKYDAVDECDLSEFFYGFFGKIC